MKRIVLISAYMPDEKVIRSEDALYAEGFEIVIVNDGSPEDFDSVSGYEHVICRSKNKGKCEAIKTGLRFIRYIVHYTQAVTVY